MFNLTNYLFIQQIPKFEKEFFETYAYVKAKNEIIYNKDTVFFPDIPENSENNEKKQKKEKPLYLRDYERKIITERNGKISDSEDENDFDRKNNITNSLTYVEEQRRLKQNISQALNADDEDTDLFKLKTKTNDEQVKEEQSYKEWLKGQAVEPENVNTQALKPLRDYWTDPKLESGEKFLRDYVLNEKYLDNSTGDNEELDWECRAHDSDENLSADEENFEKQKDFERKYNFRFEEPDQEFIKQYPRTMEDSLRKKDTKRSQKRAELKQRKEETKIRQKEELKQLKALKRKEILNKIAQLKEITGNDDIKLDEADLEADFDPAEYDRKMSEMFDEQYYDTATDNIKPEFPEVDDELGIESTWDDYDPNNVEIVNEQHCEDAEFNMDAEYNENVKANKKSLQDELAGPSKKKRRRRSKFAELINKVKPAFDPKVHSSFKSYIEEYYALDHEDMIGDLPCRFKYRNVVPNDYGLTVEEILMADDRELNKWCSLKKALQHKSEREQLIELEVYKKKAQSEACKKKILQSLYKLPEDELNNEDNNDDTTIQINKNTDNVMSNDKTKKRKRNKKTNQSNGSMILSTPDIAEKDIKINKQSKIVETAVSIKNDKIIDAIQPPMKKQKIKKSIDVTIKPEINKVKQNDEGLSKKMKRKAMFLERQRKQIKKPIETPVPGLSDERLKAFGLNPRKFKNKLKYGKKSQ